MVMAAGGVHSLHILWFLLQHTSTATICKILLIKKPILYSNELYIFWADKYLTSRCFAVYETGYWGVAIRCAPLVATIIKYCSYYDVTLQEKSSSFKYNNNFILVKVFYGVLPLMCNIKVTRSIVNFCTLQAVSFYQYCCLIYYGTENEKSLDMHVYGKRFCWGILRCLLLVTDIMLISWKILFIWIQYCSLLLKVFYEVLPLMSVVKAKSIFVGFVLP